MKGEPAADAARASAGKSAGLEDPRALRILTAEYWSLSSTRALGYQEMFGRTTIFVAVLSGTVVALAMLAQATRFASEFLWFALLLVSVDLFLGLATFVRSVAINYEDARWVAGMTLVRQAYMKIVPELEPFFVTSHEPEADPRSLAHGRPQRLANLGNSLTTTSSVVATLDSVLAGSAASVVCALLGGGLALEAILFTAVSVVSGALHVRYAAGFRRSHAPSTRLPDEEEVPGPRNR